MPTYINLFIDYCLPRKQNCLRSDETRIKTIVSAVLQNVKAKTASEFPNSFGITLIMICVTNKTNCPKNVITFFLCLWFKALFEMPNNVSFFKFSL